MTLWPRLTSTSTPKIAKSPYAAIASEQKRLHNVATAQLNALQKTLSKINGRKVSATESPQTRLEKTAAKLAASHAASARNSIIKSGESAIGGLVMGQLGTNTGSRSTQGQSIADLASAVSRAMTRDL